MKVLTEQKYLIFLSLEKIFVLGKIATNNF